MSSRLDNALRHLRSTLRMLRLIDEYTEHKAHCPRFDSSTHVEAKCECFKRKVQKVLVQAKAERWTRK